MHYDGTLRGRVSINNPIMKDKKTGKSITINRKMSPLDIEKLNKMYPCKSKKSDCDLASTQKLQDEINVLKKKRDDLKEKLENMCPCQPTGPICDPALNQEMADKLKLLNTKLDYFEGILLSSKTKIKTLDKKNKALEYRLTLEKAEIENLKNGELECEKNGFQSEFERLTSKNAEIENLQNRIRELEDEQNEFQSHLDLLTSKNVENENLRNRISELEAEKAKLQSDFDQRTLENVEIENLRNQIRVLEAEETSNELLIEKVTDRLASNIGLLTSEKAENENLRIRISLLEAEKTEIQLDLEMKKSESSKYQKEMTIKVGALTDENLNFRNSLDICQSKQETKCQKSLFPFSEIKAYHNEKKKNELSQSSRAKNRDSDQSDWSSKDTESYQNVKRQDMKSKLIIIFVVPFACCCGGFVLYIFWKKRTFGRNW